MPTAINAQDLHGHQPGPGCPHPECQTHDGWCLHHCYSCGGVFSARTSELLLESRVRPLTPQEDAELRGLDLDHRRCF